MAHTLLGVGHQGGESAMQRAAVGGRRPRVDRRGVERMAETNVAALGAKSPAISAAASPSAEETLSTTAALGWVSADAASRAVRAASGNAATRRATRWRRLPGTGSGIPASIDTSGPSALAISRANSGLPPAVAAMRRSTGWAKRVPTALDQHDQGIAIERSERQGRGVVIAECSAQSERVDVVGRQAHRRHETDALTVDAPGGKTERRWPMPNRASRHRRRRQASVGARRVQ